MFKSLGLFSSARCPDNPCHRPRCFFQHGESSNTSRSSKSTSTTSTSTPKVPKGSEETVSESAVKRKIGSTGEIKRASPEKRVKEDISLKKMGNGASKAALGEPLVASSTKAKPSVAQARAAVPAGPVVIRPGGAPSLPRDIKLSPQPYADRQKGLQTLFTQFQKLYSKLNSTFPDLASKSALAQEEEVSNTATTLAAYKLAVHQAAVSIMRRVPPDSLDHPSIGTVRESRVATELAEKEARGRLSRKNVLRYCHTMEDLISWGYPDFNDDLLINPPEIQPDATGTTQTCERCKIEYKISSENLDERFGECKYHYGKIAPERIEGKRKWIYGCCKKERGEGGCEDGIHVFSEKGEDGLLARRVPFRRTGDVLEETGWEKKGLAAFADVVGMDCEMLYTTGGSSLGRVTIIDADGNTLLDEIVRQHVSVLDPNTRFSGLDKTQLSAAVMDLQAVRAAACMFIGPNTIIAGHGLENDLRALRLLHDKIVDTAIIFPHEKGRPYRRALRDIVKEKLGYFIQERTADLGHSSAEDAKATLEVLKWKVREDAA